MWVTNPVMEKHDEIRKKYDGYCVLVVQCDEDNICYNQGMVVAYGNSAAELTRETWDYVEDNDLGNIIFDMFIDYGEAESHACLSMEYV